MSQHTSRIHIKVSSPKIWQKFVDEDDASFKLAKLANTEKTSFIIDGDWSVVEKELTGIVKALSETIGEDGIIIADTTDINVDPYNYCILYLGTCVHTVSIVSDDKCEMAFKTDIRKIPQWLSYGGFSISEKEKQVLFRCGISVVEDHIEELATDLNISDRVYLRETSFGNRSETIEKTLEGEEVYFVHSKSSYDANRLEVMGNLGSLGYLPSDVSDKLTPLLMNKHLKYVAKVKEVVPVSKRNKHTKSSIVAISIVSEFSNEEIPIKTAVSK